MRRSTFIIRRFVFRSKGKTAYRWVPGITVYLADMKDGAFFVDVGGFQKNMAPVKAPCLVLREFVRFSERFENTCCTHSRTDTHRDHAVLLLATTHTVQ